MNRKQFLSYFILTLMTAPLKAQYKTTNKKLNNEKLNYVLLNMYESPPRWLFDLPLKAFEKDKRIESPMISTCYNDLSPDYQTIKIQGLNMPSLWENNIPTLEGKAVEMKEILSDAIIIRGCNMRKDGHDVNSKAIESDSEGKTSLGGRIADHHPSTFPAISASGEGSPYKGVISAFATGKGLSAQNCSKVKDEESSYIESILKLYQPPQNTHIKNAEENQEMTELFLSELNTLLMNDTKENQFTYTQIKELQKLPFEKIFSDFTQAQLKYEKLITKSLKDAPLKNITDVKIPGITFPITFDFTGNKSVNAKDYLGAYHFEGYILTEKSISDIFKDSHNLELAKKFALCEVALKYNLTSVLLINIDPLQNISLKKAAPLGEIKHSIKDGKISFSCPTNKLFTSKPNEIHFNSDSHHIGTHGSLIGFSLFYHSLATCIYEFQQFLKSHHQNESKLYDQTVIHLTSEFERAPQFNQAGSDHGWSGHTSTLLSGKFKGLHLYGNIKVNSNNTIKDHESTWGEGANLTGLKRQMRYGDIITSIAEIFKIKSTAGGANLLNLKNGKFYPKYKDQKNIYDKKKERSEQKKA